MKSIYIAAIAALGMGAAAPALAQEQAGPTLEHPQAYVNLGYTYLNPDNHDVGELTGRAGLRLGRYWGVESEFGGGILGTHYTDGSGNRDSFGEGVAVAGYGVGYLPLMGDKLNLLARIGYGETPLTTRIDSLPGGPGFESTMTAASVNYGAGLQYMVNSKNGVRFDYTRRDFQAAGVNNLPDVNTYAVSYVHRF